MRYGDEVTGLAVKYGDNAMEGIQKYGDKFVELYKSYGDEFAGNYVKYGDDVVDVTLKYGEEGLDGIRKHGQDFLTSYSAYGDEFVQNYMRYGDEVIGLVVKYGDNAMEGIQKYGDKFLELYKSYGDEFAGNYVKYGDNAVEAYVKYGDDAEKVLEGGTEFKGDSDSKIDDIIDKIPDKYKQNGQCDSFAEKLVEQLEKRGIDYEIARVDSEFSIYSDKAGDVIGNGYHYGVKVGDTIYDNMTTRGMNFDSWLEDLGLTTQPKEIINWSIVDEILHY